MEVRHEKIYNRLYLNFIDCSIMHGGDKGEIMGE